MKNTQEMEAACCKVAGIEYCPERDDGTCLWSVSKKLRLIHPVCEDCPHHPTGPELVEKLKAWLRENPMPLGKLKFFAERLLFEVRERLNNTYMNTTVEAFIFCTPNDFVKTFYATFCKEVE